MPITADQARKLHEQLTPKLCYLQRLRRRLEHLGYVPTDPLLRVAIEAEDAIQGLAMAAYYASVGSGVGKPER